jgi:hypothetical protein
MRADAKFVGIESLLHEDLCKIRMEAKSPSALKPNSCQPKRQVDDITKIMAATNLLDAISSQPVVDIVRSGTNQIIKKGVDKNKTTEVLRENQPDRYDEQERMRAINDKHIRVKILNTDGAKEDEQVENCENVNPNTANNTKAEKAARVSTTLTSY